MSRVEAVRVYIITPAKRIVVAAGNRLGRIL